MKLSAPYLSSCYKINAVIGRHFCDYAVILGTEYRTMSVSLHTAAAHHCCTKGVHGSGNSHGNGK